MNHAVHCIAEDSGRMSRFPEVSYASKSVRPVAGGRRIPPGHALRLPSRPRCDASRASGEPRQRSSPLTLPPKPSDAPPVRVVRPTGRRRPLGMPGPYPGRVVTVKSEKCVDTTTGAANDEVVREMMARGMLTLTGARTMRDAWRRFIEPSDIVGLKVNCGGYPYCISAYEIVAEVVRQLTGSASRSRTFTCTSAFRIRWTSATMRRVCPKACRSWQPNAPIGTSTTAGTILRRTSSPISSAKRTRGPT